MARGTAGQKCRREDRLRAPTKLRKGPIDLVAQGLYVVPLISVYHHIAPSSLTGMTHGTSTAPFTFHLQQMPYQFFLVLLSQERMCGMCMACARHRGRPRPS